MSDNTISLQIDTISRNRIVEETDKNFMVEAGAGSGKTTMLVNRMVAMVEQGKDIRKICAITFTKAAAGEFYERFHKKLVERSNPNIAYVDNGHAGQLPPPTELSRKRCAEALQNIDLCFMGTIDSFCNMILSEHPSEAKIPSDATIMSDAEVDALYKQEFVRIRKGEYDRKLTEYAEAFQRLNHDAEDTFVKGMSFFMNNRNAHINFTRAPIVDVDSRYMEAKAAIVDTLAVICRNVNEYVLGNCDYKDKSNPIETVKKAYSTLRRSWGNNILFVAFYLEKLGTIEYDEKSILRDANYGDYFINKTVNARYLTGDQKSLASVLREIHYHTTLTFFEMCIPIIEKSMCEKGHMTYFDYLYYLRNMLKADAEKEGKLIRYIYDRHSFFLIDEFQDTNPMQAEVFFYLSAKQPVPEWQDCKPRPGSLFIVGDPKQSIYRFRSADVTSYLNVKTMFENPECGEVLYLTRNFRSRKLLCEHFNKVFKKTLVASKSQSAFTEIPIVEDTCAEFEGIYSYCAMGKKNKENYPDLMDEVKIGEIIQTLVNNDKFRIKDKETKDLRPIKYRDIMIITPTKTNLATIMNYLDSLEIPTRVEGKILFEENDALREVFKFYAALADSKDKIALYGALSTKAMGLSEKEILEYAQENDGIILKTQSEDKGADEAEDNTADNMADNTTTNNRVVEALKRIKALQKEAQKLSPAAIFTKIMEEFEIYRYVDADNMEVLYYALELVRDAEKAGVIVSAKDAAAYLGKLLSGNTEKERCLSLSDEQNAVHIANLHKVKGLESPIVILAYAWPIIQDPDVRIEHGASGVEGYLFTLRSSEYDAENYRFKPFFTISLFPKKEQEEKNDLACENERLVYVAATRAMNALIVCKCMYFDWRTGEPQYRSKWSELLVGSTDFLQEYSEEKNDEPVREAAAKRLALARDLYEKAVKECALESRDAEEKTYKVELPSQAKASSKVQKNDQQDSSNDATSSMSAESAETATDNLPESDDKNTEISIVHRCPELLGTMVHRLMEMMVSARNKTVAEDAAEEILREYITPATEQYEAELRKALIQVAGKMRAGGYPQVNTLPADILSTLLTADEVYTEVPFCYKEESTGVVWNGIMDVIYCKDEEWHIVDYKTNVDGTDLDKTYRGQMEAYVNAFYALTGKDADALTYHIKI